jgi:hypothetical protein
MKLYIKSETETLRHSFYSYVRETICGVKNNKIVFRHITSMKVGISDFGKVKEKNLISFVIPEDMWRENDRSFLFTDYSIKIPKSLIVPERLDYFIDSYGDDIIAEIKKGLYTLYVEPKQPKPLPKFYILEEISKYGEKREEKITPFKTLKELNIAFDALEEETKDSDRFEQKWSVRYTNSKTKKEIFALLDL